jgi:hypothetical protein
MTAGLDAAPPRCCQAFGLALQIEAGIEIPGIAPPPAEAGNGGSERMSTVTIDPAGLRRRWEASGERQRTRELRNGQDVLFSVDFAPEAGYLLSVPGYGRVLIAGDGGELLCDPERGRERWEAMLSAQALPLAATAAGIEVLHASGVTLDGEALLFAGEPGAGKSSLAAAFLRAGAKLLSDDAVAIERDGERLLAHPGTGLLQLRDGELERLGDAELARHGEGEGFAGKLRFAGAQAAEPAPLRALFLLDRDEEGPPLERLEQVDPFALLGSTFNLSVRTPERLRRHLDLVASLACSGRVHRARVHGELDATQLAALIETQMAVPK